jgi:hypothetical protein
LFGGGRFSYQQWEIFQKFDELELEIETNGVNGLFFRLHFFEFAFNKEFAIQLTKQFGIYDVWDTLRWLFMAKSVCDRECERDASASGGLAGSPHGFLYAASPDLFTQIVMRLTDLFYPVLISPDVLIAFRNNVLLLEDPRHVTCQIDLFRAHAYLTCSRKMCFFCNEPISLGKQQIFSFTGCDFFDFFDFIVWGVDYCFVLFSFICWFVFNP